MKKMLKLMLTASVSAAVMLASCTEGDLPASPTPPATEDTPVQVELKLKSEQMDTRAIDEDAINDINIYFFGNNINYHFYYPEYAPSFVFEILPGTYTLCVVTNVHKDMGGMTESELIRYKYSVDGMVDDIPMSKYECQYSWGHDASNAGGDSGRGKDRLHDLRRCRSVGKY